MFLDNDYLVQPSSIFGIRGNWPSTVSRVLAKPVYQKNEKGLFQKIVDTPGKKGEQLVWVDISSAKYISSRAIEEEIFSESSVWGEMSRALLAIGIEKAEIGYFGSKRLKLPKYKDIDFIVYGQRAFNLLRNKIDLFKHLSNTHNFTLDHAKYQALKHGAFYSPSSNTLTKCLMNKWSSCMVAEKLCSTIRFVDPIDLTCDKLEMLFELEDDEIEIEGIVTNDTKTSFMPREFSLYSNGTTYDVLTAGWIFHQCVKLGQSVRATGILKNDQLIIRNYSHGIRIV
ncbi:MAG TPA: hypothetical protein VMR37_07170 [Rhabdochlamydiaceae bacterium]|nr:hypothetical protein [Rhabdochlamydiaceae bacterium]